MQTDFLIIGQGLAGSLLAWELIRRGCRVIVVDSGKENASSIAAGIINPITGIRFVKSAEVDTLLPTAINFYQELAREFKQDFYCSKPLLRIFKNAPEVQLCAEKFQSADYQDYLGKIYSNAQTISGFHCPYGYLEQLQTGHLNTKPLLSALKDYFIQQDSYRNITIDYGNLCIESVQFEDIQAKQIIFCDGYHGQQNPWFSWLPWQCAKGEILILETQHPLPKAILNYGNWLLPQDNNRVRIGATFEPKQLDITPSEHGKHALLNALKPYNSGLSGTKVIAHDANIRPNTLDKFPFLGVHPKYPKLLIFNGFGSKGSLQIPWYAQRFADKLLNNKSLPISCDIQRHVTKYFAG